VNQGRVRAVAMRGTAAADLLKRRIGSVEIVGTPKSMAVTLHG
jgi:hypothetical protein